MQKITLSKPFASNSPVDEFDTKQIKKALNKLGYYVPYDKVGVTGIPDAAVFKALRAFQKDQGLRATGTAKPGDETVAALNSAAPKDPESHYTWHTMNDDKVRPSHAALEGAVRAWGDYPDPGDEINCRCWAEAVTCSKEFINQSVLSDIKDSKRKWGWSDYWDHFQNGQGTPIKLSETGFLGSVIEFSKSEIFPKVETQIANLAKQIEQGKLEYTTERDYEFRSISYPLGRAVVKSETIGTVNTEGKCLIIKATVSYNFSDTFTDPASLRQYNPQIKSSSVDKPDFDKNKWTEFGGEFYDITDTWQTKLFGVIARIKN